MKYVILIFSIFLLGCANVSSTKMIFRKENTTLTLDMPKEVETKNLKIKFNAQQGTFEITSESWISRNKDTIAAQSGREKTLLEGGSVLLEKTTEAAVKSAIKSAIPIP